VLKPFTDAALVGTVSNVLAERHAGRERKDYQLISVIESMVRDGYPESRIEAHLRSITGDRGKSTERRLRFVRSRLRRRAERN
jgi:hypothetical protein